MLSSFLCCKFGATRCQILRLKCTKFDFLPRWGANYSYPQAGPLVVRKVNGRVRERKEGNCCPLPLPVGESGSGSGGGQVELGCPVTYFSTLSTAQTDAVLFSRSAGELIRRTQNAPKRYWRQWLRPHQTPLGKLTAHPQEPPIPARAQPGFELTFPPQPITHRDRAIAQIRRSRVTEAYLPIVLYDKCQHKCMSASQL